jgi:hypothetical protein
LGTSLVAGASEFNNPPGVDIWCGKAYRETVRLVMDLICIQAHHYYTLLIQL